MTGGLLNRFQIAMLGDTHSCAAPWPIENHRVRVEILDCKDGILNLKMKTRSYPCDLAMEFATRVRVKAPKGCWPKKFIINGESFNQFED